MCFVLEDNVRAVPEGCKDFAVYSKAALRKGQPWGETPPEDDDSPPGE
jgi:hypothetical protein